MLTLAGVFCLMSAAWVSLGLHQLLCTRKGMRVANRGCSSNVLFPTFWCRATSMQFYTEKRLSGTTFSIVMLDYHTLRERQLDRLPIWNSQNCSMFPLAFVAGWLQGHWWGFISRNNVVWPIFLLMNVFIALKGSRFWFLFAAVPQLSALSAILVRPCWRSS